MTRSNVVPISKEPEVEMLKEGNPLFWDLNHLKDPLMKEYRKKMGNGPFTPLKVSEAKFKHIQVVHIIVPGIEGTFEVPGDFLTHVTDEEQGAKFGVRLLA